MCVCVTPNIPLSDTPPENLMIFYFGLVNATVNRDFCRKSALRSASLTVSVSKSPGHVFCDAYPWALRPTTERPAAPTYDRITASPFSTVLELDGISGTVVLDLEPLCLGGRIQWEFNGNKKRIRKWRYVSTIFLAVFCGDLPLHRPYISLIYGR